MEINENLDFKLQEVGWAHLNADKDDWRIRFTFKGIDWRYNPVSVTIGSNEAGPLARIMNSALEKYEMMKPMMPPGSEAVESFGYVTMRVGGYWDGICLGGTHLRIRNRESMDAFLAKLNEVSKRGDEIVAGLKRVADFAPRPFGTLIR